MSTGYPDGQKITQWIGAPIAQAVAAAIGAGQIVIGPTRLSSWASVIVALKPTGGQVTITVTQTVPNGPAGLVLQQQVVVPAGGTVFESFVLFGANVTITLQGAVGGTTVDYAVTPSNTTTNAQVLTNATINVQKDGVLVAAEPTLDFLTSAGGKITLLDDATNTRVTLQFDRAALAESILGAPASSVDIQNIPQTFAALELDAYYRSDEAAATVDVLTIRLNNDSGGNYDYQQLVGNAAAPSSSETFAATGGRLTNTTGALAVANSFAQAWARFPHYAQANRLKTFLSSGGYKIGVAAGNLTVQQVQNFWRSTAAINRLTLLPVGFNLVADSRVTLGGVPGA